MRNSIKKLFSFEYLPAVLFFVYIAVVHILGYMEDSDDVAVRELLLAPTLKEEMGRLNVSFVGWSSRFIINPFIFVMLHLDFRLWMIIDIIMMMIIYMGLYKLFGLNKSESGRWFMLFSALCVPFHLAVEVGWVVTSMTYIWPLAFGVVSCLTIKSYYEGYKISVGKSVMNAAFVAISSNSEGLSVALLIVFGFFLCNSAINKRLYVPFLINTIIALVSVLYHVFSPWNKSRYVSAGKPNRTLIDKLDIGISSTIETQILRYEFLILVLALISGLVVYNKYKGWRGIVGFVPLTVWVLFGLVGGLVLNDNLVPGIYEHPILCDVSLSEGKMELPITWVALAVGVTFWGFLIRNILLIYKNKQRLIMVILPMFASYAGRITGGFATETQIYYSRTYFVPLVITCVVSAVIANDYYKELTAKKAQRFAELIMVLSFIGVVRCLIECYIIG